MKCNIYISKDDDKLIRMEFIDNQSDSNFYMTLEGFENLLNKFENFLKSYKSSNSTTYR